MGKSKLKVGDTFQSTSGNTYSVIELLVGGKSKVKFNDEFGYEVVTDNTTICKGSLKNPYYRKLFGKGYFGVGPYKSKLGPNNQGFRNTREYMAWINMLSRCYYDKYTNRNTGNRVYDETEVCNDWLNFQTFSAWFTVRYSEINNKEPDINLALDKDILGEGSNLYSPQTCSLIPVSINSTMVKWSSIIKGESKLSCRLTKNGTYTITLYYHDNSIKGIKGLKSKEECLNVYLTHKRERLKELAEKYKHILEQKVYDKLIRF